MEREKHVDLLLLIGKVTKIHVPSVLRLPAGFASWKCIVCVCVVWLCVCVTMTGSNLKDYVFYLSSFISG